MTTLNSREKRLQMLASRHTSLEFIAFCSDIQRFSGALPSTHQLHCSTMQPSASDGSASAARRCSGGVTTARFIVNLLNKEMHNNRAFRTGSELRPGERADEWCAGDFATHGHVEMLRIRIAKLDAESEAALGEECSSTGCKRSSRERSRGSCPSIARAWDLLYHQRC